MNASTRVTRMAALALALALRTTATIAAEPTPPADSAHVHHPTSAAAPARTEGQRWATDAPLRAAMTRIRAGVAGQRGAFDHGKLAAAAAATLAATVQDEVQFMITHCTLDPAPDAALHALIGRLLTAASALRAEPQSPAGLPQLLAVLEDYGSSFEHDGWTPLPGQ